MLVSQRGWLLPSAPENSALSPFSLALESSQGFFSGAVSSLISCVVRSGSEARARLTWHGSMVRNCSPLPLEPCCSSGVEEQQRLSGAQQGQISLWSARAAAEPHKLPNKLFTAPLCTCIHVLVVDGPHASTKALLSHCTSGLGHTNGNKAPGTGALEASVWEGCSNILCEQDLTQQLIQHKSQSNE